MPSRAPVEYLMSKQRTLGHWEISDKPALFGENFDDANLNVNGPQYGSTTALVLFALLSAGENPQSPLLHKAIEWLKVTQLKGVYAVSLPAQCLFIVASIDNHQKHTH